MGQELQSRENKTVLWTQSIGKRRGDSTLPVEVKVESLRVELRIQGGIDLKFDSKKPDAKIDDPDLALLMAPYKVESAASYSVVLDKEDKVKAIEGIEKLREQASKLDAIAREQIRGRIEADRLKAQFEQEHRNLPDAPAKPGESWERTEVVDYGGQPLSFRKKYEYTGTEKRGKQTLDKITSKVLEVTCLPPDSECRVAAEGDQEHPQGRVLRGDDRLRPRSRLRGRGPGTDQDQGDHHLLGRRHGHLQPDRPDLADQHPAPGRGLVIRDLGVTYGGGF